jgi:glycosyltransferase involved in cell wall biosynthesis
MKTVFSPKKVLFVITKSNWGGAQRYVYDLASTISKKEEGSYIAEVAVGGSGELVKKLTDAKIPVHIISSLERDFDVMKDVRSLRELISIIKRVKPDIVHLNSSKIGLLGALAARFASIQTRKKIRVIFTAHGWAFNENRPVFQKIALVLLHWFTVLLCDKVITVSLAAKNQVISWPFLRKKISVIHNGVREIDFLPREDARLALGVNKSSTWLLGTIAELHPIKGLQYAIRGFQKAILTESDMKYVIVGEGQERLNLEQLIKENNLKERVTLVGHVSEMARYMKAFDAFILPSLSEGLGYVILEAGLASLPVIASNVGGIPEIIKNETSGLLVKSQQSDSIADNILKIKKDKNFAEKMGSTLRKRIVETVGEY